MADLRSLPFQSPDPSTADSSCTAQSLAAERMRTLINECSLGGRQQLTEARDQIDDLMRALDARSSMLLDAVTEYAGFVQGAVEMKGVIMGPIQALAAEVNESVLPSLSPTVTHTDLPRIVRKLKASDSSA